MRILTRKVGNFNLKRTFSVCVTNKKLRSEVYGIYPLRWSKQTEELIEFIK